MEKIIIADDEKRIRGLVSDFLKREGYQPLEAEDGLQAIRLFNQNPDTALLILDIMMPEIDGWEVCRRIREKSMVPVLMLTARSQEFDELMGFEAGADDYVVKPFSPTVLMKRVGALLRRSSDEKFSSAQLALDGLSIQESAHEVYLDQAIIELTLKEYDILLKMLSHTGQVFTREQLLDAIWGYDFVGDIRTVDSHVARLRTKLGKWGNRHLKTVYGMGYKIEVGDSEK